MNKILQILQVIFFVTILSIFVLPAYGCQNSASENTPVRKINLGRVAWFEKSLIGHQTQDDLRYSSWVQNPSGPYNDTIYSFNKGEEIYIYIQLESELETAVTFTKFTFYNKKTYTEEIVDLTDDYISDDLGPFEPGRDNFWVAEVPYEDGEYELKIYLGERVVASALFDVS